MSLRRISLLAACTICLTASTASAGPVIPDFPPLPPPPIPSDPVCFEPEGRALLVLLENGGVSFGIPDHVQVKRWYCSSFEHFTLTSGSVWDVLSALGSSLRSAPSCLRPSNWSYRYVSVAEMAERLTDFALELGGRALINGMGTSNYYDQLVIMEDSEFEPANVLQMLEWFADHNYLVDIHILGHGLNNAFCGHSGCDFRADPDDDDDFFDQLNEIECLSLGVIYQQNCIGASLNDDWIDAGAIAVTGADGINSMPYSYPYFLDAWLSGATINAASDAAYLSVVPFTIVLYRHVDLFTSDGDWENWAWRSSPTISITGKLSPSDEMDASRMLVDGDPSATIDDR